MRAVSLFGVVILSVCSGYDEHTPSLRMQMNYELRLTCCRPSLEYANWLGWRYPLSQFWTGMRYLWVLASWPAFISEPRCILPLYTTALICYSSLLKFAISFSDFNSNFIPALLKEVTQFSMSSTPKVFWKQFYLEGSWISVYSSPFLLHWAMMLNSLAPFFALSCNGGRALGCFGKFGPCS